MEKQIKKYFKKYKKNITPIALIVGSFVLIWVVVIPQITDINDLNRQVDIQTETNQKLRDSRNTLDSISEGQLDEDYELVLRALPVNKRIGQIFEALNSAAFASNVSIGSLNLQVGSIYEEDNNVSGPRKAGDIPVLSIIVRVNSSSATDATRFAQSLYDSIPIVEINAVSATDSEGRYDVDFFFKPINTDTFEAQANIQPLTPALQEVLTTLRSWD